MAICTYLQLVSDDEISDLTKHPKKVNKINKPDKETYTTYYQCSINYFLSGSAYSPKGDMAGMLDGTKTIETSSLENGNFGVVPSKNVPAIRAALDKVSLDKLKKKVKNADPDELEDNEVDDWEVLTDGDKKPEETLVHDIRSLLAFYKKAEKEGKGVVMYTT